MSNALKRRLAAIDRSLEKEYGCPARRTGDPLDALIATILSQNTNDTNSARAYSAMREAFPTWRDVMRAPPNALEDVLRPGGLAKTKGRRIQRILRAIAGNGPLNLDYLRRLDTTEAENALLAFDGVGPKTARCVLLFALGRDVFPVDTHIERVLKRIGVLPASMTAEQAHAYLPPFIPAGHCLGLHVNLIAHGRQVCHPRNPECGHCVLKRRCDYYKNAQ